MKILFVGDVVGSVGRQMLVDHLDTIKQEKQIDFTIVNGENSAHGKGISKKIYHQFLNAGCDVITLGNHAYSKDTIFTFIDDAHRLVRPMNMPPSNGKGQGYCIVDVNGLRICVSNIMCEVFMIAVKDNPFDTMIDILEETKDLADIHIVDLHGEATSEKIAFSYYFEGVVQAVLGTHTHVQTADERVSNGTAFISDVGMCGVYRSVIGRDIDEILNRFVNQEKTRFTLAEGEGMFSAVVIEIDEVSKQAVHIERIQVKPQ